MGKREHAGEKSAARRAKTDADAADGHTPPPALPTEAMHEEEDEAMAEAMESVERGIPAEIAGQYNDLVALMTNVQQRLKTPTASVPVDGRRAIAQKCASMILALKDRGPLGLLWPYVADSERHVSEQPPVPLFGHLTDAQVAAVGRMHRMIELGPQSEALATLADDACFLFGLASNNTPELQTEQVERMAAYRRRTALALLRQLDTLKAKYGDAEKVVVDNVEKPNPYHVLRARAAALRIDPAAIKAEDRTSTAAANNEFERLRAHVSSYAYLGQFAALADAHWDLLPYPERKMYKSGLFIQTRTTKDAADKDGVLGALRTNPPHPDVQALRRGRPQPFEMFGYGKAIDGSNPQTQVPYLRLLVPPFVPTYPIRETGNLIMDMERHSKLAAKAQQAMTSLIEDAKHNIQASNMPYVPICAEIAPGVPQPTNALMDFFFIVTLRQIETLFLQLLTQHPDIQGLLMEAAGDSNLTNGAGLSTLLDHAANDAPEFLRLVRDRILYGAYCKFSSKLSWVRRENNDHPSTPEEKRNRPCWLSVRGNANLMLMFEAKADYKESGDDRKAAEYARAGPVVSAIFAAERSRILAIPKNANKTLSLKALRIVDKLGTAKDHKLLPVPVISELPYECGTSAHVLVSADFDLRGTCDADGASFVSGDVHELRCHGVDLQIRESSSQQDACSRGEELMNANAASKEHEAKMQRMALLARAAQKKAAEAALQANHEEEEEETEMGGEAETA